MKTLEEIRQIVDNHRQLSLNSCSPSLIELILKIEGCVGSDYYELQKKYGDQNVGLEVFSNQTIGGLTFRKHNLVTDGPFGDRIKLEWKAQKLFAIYMLNEGSKPSYHGWIVADVAGDRVSLLSKFSEEGHDEGKRTATGMIHVPDATPPKMTDLLTYTKAQKT